MLRWGVELLPSVLCDCRRGWQVASVHHPVKWVAEEG